LTSHLASAAKGTAFGLFTYIAFFGAAWLPLPWLQCGGQYADISIYFNISIRYEKTYIEVDTI